MTMGMVYDMLIISIHALLAESDRAQILEVSNQYDFYPRSPCGERQGRVAVLINAQQISIHALLAESDGF